MGVLRRLVTLPLAPVEGLLWLADVLRQVAEAELHDPERLRAVIEEAEAAHGRGELTDEALEQVEQEVLQMMLDAPGPLGGEAGGAPVPPLGAGEVRAP